MPRSEIQKKTQTNHTMRSEFGLKKNRKPEIMIIKTESNQTKPSIGILEKRHTVSRISNPCKDCTTWKKFSNRAASHSTNLSSFDNLFGARRLNWWSIDDEDSPPLRPFVRFSSIPNSLDELCISLVLVWKTSYLRLYLYKKKPEMKNSTLHLI